MIVKRKTGAIIFAALFCLWLPCSALAKTRIVISMYDGKSVKLVSLI
jgi:hypothetical protein